MTVRPALGGNVPPHSRKLGLADDSSVLGRVGLAFGNAPSPERVKNGSCGHKRDFALLQPLDEGLNVFPILISLLKVIENTSVAFIDLAQDETRVVGRSRAGIHRIRELRALGHVVVRRAFSPLR